MDNRKRPLFGTANRRVGVRGGSVQRLQFGASCLRWSLLIDPDSDSEEIREGDDEPKYVGLYLCLTEDEENVNEHLIGVDASCTLQVFCTRTDSWETLSEWSERFIAGGGTGRDGSCQLGRAFSHEALYAKKSDHISPDGILIVRATVDFEIESNRTTKCTAATCARYADLCDSEDCSDFEPLSSDQVSFPVHRIILAAHSSVFQKMFEHGTKENEAGRVEIEDFDWKILIILLKFIYAGDITDVEGAAEKVLEAADKYDVSDLRDLAVTYLCEGGIADTNAYRLWTMADRRNSPKLRKAVSGFFFQELGYAPPYSGFHSVQAEQWTYVRYFGGGLQQQSEA